MRTTVLTVSLLLCSVSSLSQITATANAVDTNQATETQVVRDTAAIAALQNSLGVLGAVANGVPSSIAASGTYSKFNGDGSQTNSSIRVKVSGTDKFRREIDLADGTHTAIVRGTVGYAVSPLRTDGLPMGYLAGSNFEDFPVLAIATWLTSASVQLQIVGTETIGTTNVIHISVQPTRATDASDLQEKVYRETKRAELYLDAQTYLPVRIRFYAHPTDWRLAIPNDLDLGDYRPVSGVLFPFSVSRSIHGQKISTTTYQTMILNVPMSDTDFTAEVTQ